MRPDQHKAMWDKIHSSNQLSLPASLVSSALPSERKRLQAYWEAQINRPKTCPYQPKRFVKGKAKGVGQHLKNSFIKSSSGTIDNPSLRGKYASINKPKEYKDADKEIQSVTHQKPTLPENPTKHWPEYCVELPWDQGIDDYKFTTRYHQPRKEKQ